jgi:uncharacterized protein YdeI (YjbR/CyaY-like superfamily)
MGAMDEAERLEPSTVEGWSDWLHEHHEQPTGVWLVSPRKAAERPFSYEEAVLEALRYGWVDSTVKPVDDLRSMQWFAPRRTGSLWTRSCPPTSPRRSTAIPGRARTGSRGRGRHRR